MTLPCTFNCVTACGFVAQRLKYICGSLSGMGCLLLGLGLMQLCVYSYMQLWGNCNGPPSKVVLSFLTKAHHLDLSETEDSNCLGWICAHLIEDLRLFWYLFIACGCQNAITLVQLFWYPSFAHVGDMAGPMKLNFDYLSFSAYRQLYQGFTVLWFCSATDLHDWPKDACVKLFQLLDIFPEKGPWFTAVQMWKKDYCIINLQIMDRQMSLHCKAGVWSLLSTWQASWIQGVISLSRNPLPNIVLPRDLKDLTFFNCVLLIVIHGCEGTLFGAGCRRTSVFLRLFVRPNTLDALDSLLTCVWRWFSWWAVRTQSWVKSSYVISLPSVMYFAVRCQS